MCSALQFVQVASVFLNRYNTAILRHKHEDGLSLQPRCGQHRRTPAQCAHTKQCKSTRGRRPPIAPAPSARISLNPKARRTNPDRNNGLGKPLAHYKPVWSGTFNINITTWWVYGADTFRGLLYAPNTTSSNEPSQLLGSLVNRRRTMKLCIWLTAAECRAQGQGWRHGPCAVLAAPHAALAVP